MYELALTRGRQHEARVGQLLAGQSSQKRYAFIVEAVAIPNLRYAGASHGTASGGREIVNRLLVRGPARLQSTAKSIGYVEARLLGIVATAAEEPKRDESENRYLHVP